MDANGGCFTVVLCWHFGADLFDLRNGWSFFWTRLSRPGRTPSTGWPLLSCRSSLWLWMKPDLKQLVWATQVYSLTRDSFNVIGDYVYDRVCRIYPQADRPLKLKPLAEIQFGQPRRNMPEITYSPSCQPCRSGTRPYDWPSRSNAWVLQCGWFLASIGRPSGEVTSYSPGLHRSSGCPDLPSDRCLGRPDSEVFCCEDPQSCGVPSRTETYSLSNFSTDMIATGRMQKKWKRSQLLYVPYVIFAHSPMLFILAECTSCWPGRWRRKRQLNRRANCLTIPPPSKHMALT